LIGKSKITFLVTLDRRIDALLRKEAMKLGISKSEHMRRILQEALASKGHNINDILNQVP